MNKSVLVFNVPEDFEYWRCSIGGDGNIYYEREGEQRTSIIGNIKNLRPLPQKKGKYDYLSQYDADNHYEIGWNDCLDALETKPKTVIHFDDLFKEQEYINLLNKYGLTVDKFNELRADFNKLYNGDKNESI